VETIKPPVAVLAYFDSSTITGAQSQIDLQINIPNGNSTAHFAQTVPFASGKTIPVQQTVIANGQKYTLDRVVLTSSAARFYFSSAPDLLPPIMWNLSVGGKSYQINWMLSKVLTMEGDFSFLLG